MTERLVDTFQGALLKAEGEGTTANILQQFLLRCHLTQNPSTQSMVRTRILPLDFPCLDLGNLAASQPSCLPPVAWLQLNDFCALKMRVSAFKNPVGSRWLKWLEREFTDQKIRGSKPTSATRLHLSRLGQPGSIPALVPPWCGMVARHRKGAIGERLLLLFITIPLHENPSCLRTSTWISQSVFHHSSLNEHSNLRNLIKKKSDDDVGVLSQISRRRYASVNTFACSDVMIQMRPTCPGFDSRHGHWICTDDRSNIRARLDSSASLWCGLTGTITPEQEDDRSNESGVAMNKIRIPQNPKIANQIICCFRFAVTPS
ncbi:hypothetical protein T265_10902 [Opisthorchis viverrini]|uniref:Uncharacterized protein n=1 Tax=Opisthorchis viverrini TaxID=6198 RepID=A0A074ZZI0_OPIVI|nr:hypothetical protein T265_10902 [Opisthorchis viverrini]KER20579.1 hypothetical protein T265_10902 [Opisthorchis viverrini]